MSFLQHLLLLMFEANKLRTVNSYWALAVLVIMKKEMKVSKTDYI
jgi:hypothetical protein